MKYIDSFLYNSNPLYIFITVFYTMLYFICFYQLHIYFEFIFFLNYDYYFKLLKPPVIK